MSMRAWTCYGDHPGVDLPISVPKGDNCDVCGASEPSAASSSLAALEAREEQINVFLDCEEQARKYLASEGSDKLVAELREARAARKRIKLGTPNTLVLLAHIDKLEAALTEPYRG